MTDAVSVGPDVNAILNGDGGAPATVVDSNFSDDGSGTIRMEGTPPSTEEPAEELILGKFKSQEDLEKAYKELESKLGSKPAEEAPAEEAPAEDNGVPKMGEEPTEGEPEVEAEAEAEGEEGQGLNFEAFGKEVAENGTLSDASFEAIEKAGIPRDIAEGYLAGLQATQTLRGQQLYTAAGGEDEFKALVKWGSANLPPEQQDAFNNSINAAILEGDFTSSSMMIQAVKAQMGNGEPNLLNTVTGAAGDGVQPFANRSEMVEAMRDPRYSSDPGFVQQVQKRLAISDF